MRLARSLLLLALLPGIVRAGDDELQRLRQENAQLRAQLQALQSSCPSTATAALAMPPGSAAKTVSQAPPAPALAAAARTSPSAPALPVPPPGYMLVKAPEVNSETGCTRGIFSSGPDRPWKHQDAWDALHTGMSADEVSSLLGTDHYDVDSHGRRMWQYGKCGVNVEGYVLFDGNAASFWKTPDF